MVVDWMMLSRIVKYRVYCVILRRPSSPSFCSFSRYGNTTVINCKMMDAVIYGMMPNAKIVRRRKLPLLEQALQHAGIDARCGDMRADAVHREQRHGKQHPVPQIGDAEEISECL